MTPEPSDEELIASLRDGDEQAFVVLVQRYHSQMLNLARTFVATRSVAEEVVQDAWLGVVRGIGSFEGRSSLKTWILRILINRARTVGPKEHRETRFAGRRSSEEPSRFAADGTWAAPLPHWSDAVDDRLSAEALCDTVHSAIATLPRQQRLVVTLRDVDGLSSTEVCALLSLKESHQRVLLHRGRSTIRRIIEPQLVKG
jgi:RNA polymerase sigma-70 factor (ECF subfamily)